MVEYDCEILAELDLWGCELKIVACRFGIFLFLDVYRGGVWVWQVLCLLGCWMLKPSKCFVKIVGNI